MKAEATGEIRPIDIAFDVDNLSVGLEELTLLLQIYDEHREDELSGINPIEPHTVSILIERQSLGLALLRAIEDKAAQLRELADSITQRAYELSSNADHATAESKA